MPIGTCRLCLHPAELRESHYMPAASYGLLRSDDGKNDPILVNVTKQKAIQVSAQVKGYMLCGDCEDRFNDGGEAWVLGHCWRSESEFPLREALWAAYDPANDDGETMVFEGRTTPGVDADRVAYFGCSMFWRATLTGWREAAGLPAQRLDFGLYAEGLRRFLLREGDIPANMVLVVTLTNYRAPVPVRGLASFPHITRHEPYRQYRFVLLGITFDLLVGNRIPAKSREWCAVRTGRMFGSFDMDTINVSEMMRSLGKVRPVGRLLKNRPPQ
jgi:hypothetical protein